MCSIALRHQYINYVNDDDDDDGCNNYCYREDLVSGILEETLVFRNVEEWVLFALKLALGISILITDLVLLRGNSELQIFFHLSLPEAICSIKGEEYHTKQSMAICLEWGLV